MWDTWQRTPESLATCTVSSTASTASTSLLRVWQAYIASYRAATPHRSTVSRWEAIRSHEDSRPVEYPNAPASSPSSSRLVICSISSGEAGRSSKPITAMRRLPLGTSEATLIAGRAESSASRYSENVRHVISVRGVVSVDVAGEQVGVGNRSAAVTAVAYQLRGYALVDRALGARIDQKGKVGVAVNIDEARRDDKPLGVDHVPALGLIEGIDNLYAVARDPNVCRAARTA